MFNVLNRIRFLKTYNNGDPILEQNLLLTSEKNLQWPKIFKDLLISGYKLSSTKKK